VNPRLRSLLWRIVSLHVIALLIATAAILLTVVGLLNSTFAREEHLTLRRHERELMSVLSRKGDVWSMALTPALRDEYAGGPEGFAFAVVDDRRRVQFSSLANGHALFPVASSKRPGFFQEERPGGLYAGASFPETSEGRRYWVQVAQDLTKPDMIIDDVILSYLRRIGWLFLPIMFVLAAVDVVIVRRALQPVVNASHRAEAITPANLAVRLPDESLPTEIAPLARAVNRALDRLEEGFNRQREFTADAAHELRTPLSILRMRVEASSDREMAKPLLDDIDAMTRVVSQLLEMSELDALLVDPDLRTDLHDLGERVVTYMAPYALARRKRIALTGADGPVWVRGDPDILFQAARNLVENAIEHTPARRSVEVEVSDAGVLRVLDSGPGIGPEERELIFRRFWRRNRRLSKGAGLGLAIVWRIVEAHGGRIEVENRPQGGAAFTIQLNPSAGSA
jgi:signal transduction histidine kinase